MTLQATGPEIRRSERASHIVILTVVVGLLMPLLLWPAIALLVWWAQPESPVDVLVYDQTVPDATFLEHASLGLALDYEKVPFETDSSFVGAAPGGWAHGDWPSVRPDLVMLVDAYGVYVDDTGEVADDGTRRVTDRFDEEDAATVLAWASQGSLVYGEFNVLGEPTSSPASQALERLFGVRRTGWAGRSYDDLAAVSDRLVTLAGGDWPHSGPGLVLLAPTTDGASVVVLTQDALDATLPTVEGTLPGSEREMSSVLDGWFELVTADANAEVHASLYLPVNDAGRSVLAARGIPAVSPFIVRTEGSLYLAADASENHVEFPLRRMAGSATLMRVVPQSRATEFFYRVYLPVVQWLVEEAETS